MEIKWDKEYSFYRNRKLVWHVAKTEAKLCKILRCNTGIVNMYCYVKTNYGWTQVTGACHTDGDDYISVKTAKREAEKWLEKRLSCDEDYEIAVWNIKKEKNVSIEEAKKILANWAEAMMTPFELNEDREYEEMRNPRRPVGVLVK